jgi:hypothetical protein
MGQTLKELLESDDLGAGRVKTAGVKTDSDVDGMDKLAMQLGLFGAIKVAAEEENEDKEEEKEDSEEKGEEKAASVQAGGLHSLLFPDSVLSSTEKTAAEKQAEAEFRRGAKAYDQFAKSLDVFVEKMASEVISGSPHGDSQPNNRLPNNKPANAAAAIDTDPEVTDNVKAKNDASTVGHYEQKTAAAMAFRKHILLSQLSN